MEKVELIEIGRGVRHCGKQLGYTQEQLAEMMNVSIQMVSNLQRGNKAIRIDNLVNLSRILRVSTDYILKGMEPVEISEELTSGLRKPSEKDRKMLELPVTYCLSEET